MFSKKICLSDMKYGVKTSKMTFFFLFFFFFFFFFCFLKMSLKRRSKRIF